MLLCAAGLVDAHFARAMQHILRFMKYWQRNRIRAIVSPRGLAAALAWKGGVRNSAVQLVRINSERLQQLSTSVEAVVQKLSMYFTRCCDIQYGNISNEDETVLKVALHSGYNVAKFHVTFPTESKRAHVELVEANQQMDDRSRDVDSQPSDPVTEDDETQPPNSMTLKVRRKDQTLQSTLVCWRTIIVACRPPSRPKVNRCLRPHRGQLRHWKRVLP
mmetsp:Transcript_36273/g.53193  ORF Transcript_36273/g.53193 Transcript_36273/m.53193 type:complete len:218 (+) Transcript_36273:2043-2696(+)